ncbi:hypothetical protein M436DRAFT_67367 [Aureobasidium namibiae CBS 147.97]|uniref:Uncharacterized protein n=1 Tax=Aureobasidium namibiae CBS 147.97 TaxID=1043004 RepID=A0A074W8U8_9PEZI
MLTTSPDTGAQEKLGLRYNFTPELEKRRHDESWCLNIMASYLWDWGDMWLLGDRALDEIIASRKRKRDAAAEDDVRASKVAALPDTDASISSHGTHHAPHPPPLVNSGIDLPATNTIDSTCPPAQRPTSQHIQPNITQQSFTSQDSVYLGDFRSNFDFAFARWIDEGNITEAAIARLFKDPALAPLTQSLSWKSERQLEEKVDRLDFARVEYDRVR